METIQITQEALTTSLEAPVFIETPQAVSSLGRTVLTGVEARLAQAANLTRGVRPLRLPYFGA